MRNEKPFRDETKDALDASRQEVRSAVQQALLSLWEIVSIRRIQPVWNEFWAAWDAYTALREPLLAARREEQAARDAEPRDYQAVVTARQRAGDIEWRLEEAGAEFDRVSAKCARFTAGEFTRLTREIADCARLSLAASDACSKSAQLAQEIQSRPVIGCLSGSES